jgi:Tol biopolymer transport system component
VEGDVAQRTFRVIAEDIECPSLSPDETHIAFKKRFGKGFDAWWQPAIVDLATMTVRQLPESKHIDDQIEWLDDGHILYAVGHSTSAIVRRADIWTIAIDGASSSSIFLADAESPAVVRR